MPLLSDTSHAYVFNLKILVESIFGPFSSNTRLFESTVRMYLWDNASFIDTNDTRLQGFSHAPYLAKVTWVEITCWNKAQVAQALLKRHSKSVCEIVKFS